MEPDHTSPRTPADDTGPDGGQPERRHATRATTPGLSLTITTPRRRLLARLRRAPVHATATVVDLSLTGARLRIPDSVDIDAGQEIHVGNDGRTAHAIVRHCDKEPYGKICGIEFTGTHNPATSPFFTDLISTHPDLKLAWDDE